ncbi:MAG: hypothetical protein AB4911_00830 [Oscillochloridaceae bacterium umkhey_bin13]
MRTILLALLALLIAGLIPAAPASAQTNDARCFPETGFCISGNIRRYWERNGGLSVFGYPTGPVETMTIEGWIGPAQWFERDRLEDHANQGLGVLAGRLGAERLEQQGRPWQPGTSLPLNSSCRFFPPTAHYVCGEFRNYWERNGGLERFGYPLTGELTEIIEGRPLLVQYFERRRMELHPQNRPPYNVLLGLLGNEVRATAATTSCAFTVLSELQGNYRAFGGRERLGCPQPGQDFSFIQGATARFERGQMYWINLRGGRSVVVVLFYDANGQVSQQIFEDYWQPGDPETSGLTPPRGLVEPRRGFGKIWREQPGVRERLGWALETEREETLSFQQFQHGDLLYPLSENRVWELHRSGTARSEARRYE